MLSNVDDLKDVLSRELSCFKALDRWIILLQIIQRVEASRAENQHKTEHIHIDDYDSQNNPDCQELLEVS